MTSTFAKNHTSGEMHKVKPCNRCGGDIVLLKSKTGKWYPADVISWSAGQNDRHSGDKGAISLVVQPWRGMHRCAA